ncbi:MAG: ATP-dependent DNA helicase RecG [Anaerolineales bacterium]|nr:ATP-dependent DNA helicase RecG [Anaerolineales bacterium]
MPVGNLIKILRLEAERLEDRAVYGGLAGYAHVWAPEARAALGPGAAEWIGEIVERLQTYAALPDPQARKAAVETLLELAESPPQSKPRRKAAPGTAQVAPLARNAAAGRPKDARLGLESPLTALHGVGPKQAEHLARLGLHTIRDLLFCFPRRHDDYSHLKTIGRLTYSEEVTIIAHVVRASVYETRHRGKIFKATLRDSSGTIEASWFNQPYLINQIRPKQQIVVSGRVDQYLGRLCFTSPAWESADGELLHTARLVPVYPLTEGLTAKSFRKLAKQTVDYWAKRVPDHLPDWVRQDYQLLDLGTALAHAHFPDSAEALQRANYRLAFDELFVLQIGLLRQRHLWRSEPSYKIEVGDAPLEALFSSLPFALTTAQTRAIEQVVRDMRSDQPMNRLLQGDVGSGKTVVAAAAMLLATAAGAQAALMAPTEILSEQHYRTLERLFSGLGEAAPRVRLLTGSTGQADREATLAGLSEGSVDIAVGTHALIQEGVGFRALALGIIDEQHRFGVHQRAALRQKAYNPHLLVMTATPIPRSLQLTLWGHMDVSVIDEMPPGRQPIVTRVITPLERERAYHFVRSQVAKGRQAFIICPLVEGSDKIEAKSAIEEYQRLRQSVFPDLRLGLLHGRMKGEEKDGTMSAFARGELDILVATSVVEVGVDVPNATVMLIEGAERFGLAQLHQFRGRVGRGQYPSYCLLISETDTESGRERLQAVEATLDGFELAQKDLEMRGPGEFLGARQSGFPELQLSSVSNLRLVETAREAARRLFDEDSDLAHPENELLAHQVAQLWKGEGDVS